MKQPLISIVLLLSILIPGKSGIAQQNLTTNNKLSEITLLDSLDYCSKYTLNVSVYYCFTCVGFDIEVYKDEQGYYTFFCNNFKKSLYAKGCQMKYLRLSNAQFNKIREFEMNLGKGHEHQQDCSGTTYVNISINNSKKHFQHCGCGSDAYLEIKNILLPNQN